MEVFIWVATVVLLFSFLVGFGLIFGKPSNTDNDDDDDDEFP